MSNEMRPVPGTSSQKLPPWWKRFGVTAEEDWSGVIFYRRMNWTNFTFIEISGEIEWHMGSAEFSLGLLGFTVDFTWFWASPKRDELLDMMEAVKRGEIVSIPFEQIPRKESHE